MVPASGEADIEIMKKRPAWLVTVLVCSALGARCATSVGGARPRPFPGAPAIDGRVGERTTADRARSEAVLTALAQRGVPYRLGGELPETGFDCSGLVRYAFQSQHIALPRTVAEQFRVGERVRASDAAAGDLVFFTITTPGPSHVGVVVDAATFVHAPDTGGVVRVERFDTPYWSSRLTGVRRVTAN
jgi:cell wall-associated NlpC family hydrolase